MKRLALFVLVVLLIFSGCAQSREDPFKVDTVVYIPVDPTEEPVEEPAAVITEAPTEEATEAPTEEPTEPEETEAKKTSTTSKSSSSKKSSSSSKKNSSSKKKNKPKETEPPVIETAAPTRPPFDPSDYTVGGEEYSILDEMNASRADKNAAELDIDELLSGIACLRAMEVSDAWSHTRPDGRAYQSALSDYGFGYDRVEELMYHTPDDLDAQTVVDKWMNSKSHKKIVLDGDFTTAGIGIYTAGGITYMVCLLVG